MEEQLLFKYIVLYNITQSSWSRYSIFSGPVWSAESDNDPAMETDRALN